MAASPVLRRCFLSWRTEELGPGAQSTEIQGRVAAEREVRDVGRANLAGPGRLWCIQRAEAKMISLHDV